MGAYRNNTGFTLIEVLIATALAAMILVGASNLVSKAVGTEDVVAERNQLRSDARFAMQRMVAVTSESRRLLLPLQDNPASNWPEHIREETVPASPPIGDSTMATAVLAVTLPASVDLDGDGVPDADDDGDGLIDEDLPNDAHHDFFAGIMLIDDNGDGQVDEGNNYSDDESATDNDDPVNGIDDDGDGSIDEDPATDINGDGCAGICGVDDDANGVVDNGGSDDDDEDGSGFDDPYDPVVYSLNGSSLIERMPVPWNEDGISAPDGPVDGRDYVESVIAENVTRFRVERLATASDAETMVNLQLDLTGPSGATITLEADVRVGGAL